VHCIDIKYKIMLTRVAKIVCAAIFIFHISGVAAQVVNVRQKAVPEEFFGMHIHRADRGTAWPEYTKSWRLWDSGVAWIDIEPKQGEVDFSRLDRYVSMARYADSGILYPFGLTPQWAASRPGEKGVYRPGDTSEPKDILLWRTHVESIVRRYRGKIKAYELWNEVNPGTGFYTGTLASLLELQRVLYDTVKEVDPTALVASASSVGESDHQLAWFEKYIQEGGGRRADVIAYHFYQPKRKPEDILALVSRVREIISRHGLSEKALWNTESGYRMPTGFPQKATIAPSWPQLDTTTSTAYVMRSLILGWAAGLDRFYSYAWDNRELGFLGPDGKRIEASEGLLAAQRWMLGAVFKSCISNDQIWTCELYKGSRRAWIVWDSRMSDGRQWQLPATVGSGSWILEDYKGRQQSIGGGAKVRVGAVPMFVHESSKAW
jgi:hypothetical protein